MKLKQALLFVFELIQIAIIALVIVLPIRYFIFQPFVVKGASMEPNFSSGDYLIVDELSYRLREPIRGEVIVFKYPSDPSQRFIKRIVGLPNEIIELSGNKIKITAQNGQEIVLDETDYLTDPSWSIQTTINLKQNEYFVLGDNRQHSFDSRRWGAVPREDIIGRVILRAWPLTALAAVAAPEY